MNTTEQLSFSLFHFLPPEKRGSSYFRCRGALVGWERECEWVGSGELFPSPEDFPNPGIEPMSPSLQVDSLPTDLSGKPSGGRGAFKNFPLTGCHGMEDKMDFSQL